MSANKNASSRRPRSRENSGTPSIAPRHSTHSLSSPQQPPRRQVGFISPTHASRSGSNVSEDRIILPQPPHAKLQNKTSADHPHRRLEQVARARDRREAMLKRVRTEKKLMLFSSILAFLALFLWLAAVFTDHWFYVTQTEEKIASELNTTRDGSTVEVFVVSNTGLWRTCHKFRTAARDISREQCFRLSIFLSRDESSTNPRTLNEHVIDYTRAQISFAFISVLLMTMTIVAAFYTFKNSRYVYKRLAACLYFMTTISMLVVLEVLTMSVNYAEGHKLYPDGAAVTYGWSYYMGWFVFLVYLVNGCIFLVLSRKRKYDKDDDGSQIMSR